MKPRSAGYIKRKAAKEETVEAFTRIVNRQIAWAEHRGLLPDENAYLTTYDENLFAPLSAQTEREFRGGAGCELDDRNDEPAKMRALYSSSALVCNVFDHLRNANATSIGRFLAIANAVASVRFEAQLPSGLRGTPPTLDLLLIATATIAVAVESKFTEPYQGRPKRAPFVESYFKAKTGLWASLGLPKCQNLAERLHRREIRFEYLDAAQLLKHTLGVRRKFRDGQLVLLWFNSNTSEGEALSSEIRFFSQSVDSALSFRAIEYHDVFACLEQEPSADPRHVDYLRSRYFAAQQTIGTDA